MKGKAKVETEYQVQYLDRSGAWSVTQRSSSKREAGKIARLSHVAHSSFEWRVVRSRTEHDVVLEIARKAPK